MYAFQFSSYDKTIFTKSYQISRVAPSLKPQISQKFLYHNFMLPDSKNFFDALLDSKLLLALTQYKMSGAQICSSLARDHGAQGKK